MDDLHEWRSEWEDLFNNFPARADTQDSKHTEQWQVVMRDVLKLYERTLTELIQCAALPLSREYYYWQSVNADRSRIVYHGLSNALPQSANWIRSLDPNLFQPLAWHFFQTFSMRRSLLQMYESPLWLYRCWRNDVRTHKHHVRAYKNHVATVLGFMVQRSKLLAPIPSASVEDLCELVSKSLVLLASSLNLLLDTPPAEPQRRLGGLYRSTSQQTLDQIQAMDDDGLFLGYGQVFESVLVAKAPNLTTEGAQAALLQVDKQCDQMVLYFKHVLLEQGRPVFWVRYWIPGLLGLWSLRLASRYLATHGESLLHWASDFRTTTVQFVNNWLLEPVYRIWKTVRHEDTLRLTSGAASLSADLDSLERMVVDYARDRNMAVDVESLRAKVRDGDLTLVLQQYEQDMKTPVRSAIAGDMIRVVLIQVQKTKVDLETAMQALDKLLRSNELNFAFLAVAPTLLILGAGWRWIRLHVSRQRRQSVQVVAVQMKKSLREIERLLNETAAETVSFVIEGHVLMEVTLLRDLGLALPAARRLPWFEDVHDLTSLKTVRQRQQTLQRMHQYYGFLQCAE